MDIDRLLQSSPNDLTKLRSRTPTTDDRPTHPEHAKPRPCPSTSVKPPTGMTTPTSSSSVIASQDQVKQPDVNKMIRLITKRECHTQSHLSPQLSESASPVISQPTRSTSTSLTTSNDGNPGDSSSGPASHHNRNTTKPALPADCLTNTVPGAFPRMVTEPMSTLSPPPHLSTRTKSDTDGREVSSVALHIPVKHDEHPKDVPEVVQHQVPPRPAHQVTTVPQQNKAPRNNHATRWTLYVLTLVAPLVLLLPVIIAPCSIWLFDVSKDAYEMLHSFDRYDGFVASQTIHTIWTNTSALSEVICNLDDLQCFLQDPGSVSIDQPWFRDRSDRLFASKAFPIPCPDRACIVYPPSTPALPEPHRWRLAQLLAEQQDRVDAILLTMLKLEDIARQGSVRLKGIATSLATELVGSSWPWRMIETAEALYDVPTHCNQAGMLGCKLWQYGWCIIKATLPKDWMQSSRLGTIEAKYQENRDMILDELNTLPHIEGLERACVNMQDRLEEAFREYGCGREMQRIATSIREACRFPSIEIPTSARTKEQLALSQALWQAQHEAERGIDIPVLLGVSGGVPLIDSSTGQKIERGDVFVRGAMAALLEGGSSEVKESITGEKEKRSA